METEDVSLGGKWRRFGDLPEVSAWLESVKSSRKAT